MDIEIDTDVESAAVPVVSAVESPPVPVPCSAVEPPNANKF